MASNPNEANESQIGSNEADKIKVNDYCFLLQEGGKAGFSANDLVWGKIKSHPWWPGQIFDPQYASEMALKCQKKNHFLVAYFGDKTFAWVPKSQLKPFQPCFSEMEEQSGGVSFQSAVGAILEEVSKRIELGLACRCSADDGGYDKLFERRKVENAGVREGTCSVVDKFTVGNAFRPESLLGYVWALAQCPSRGFVRLELTVAVAQLKAFYHFKGRTQLPIFASCDGLVEDEVEISHVKSTRPRGRPRKIRANEDGSEQEHPSNKMDEEEDTDLGRREKDVVGEEVELKTGARSSARTRTRSVKLADHISEDANRLKDKSPLILNPIDETPQNSGTKRSQRKGADHLSMAEKENEVIKEYSSPSAMLSQLYQVARDPVEGYKFLPMIQGFFIDFRVSYFSSSSDNQESVKSTGRKRGRKKKVAESEPASLEMSDPDFGFSPSSNSSEDQEPVKSAGRKRGRKKKVVNCEPASIEMSDPDFRFSPSSDSLEDQEPVKSVGRKSSRKKKKVNFERDYVLDSYWSDIILHSSPEREPASKGQKWEGGSKKKGRPKMTEAVGESVLHDPMAPSMDTEHDNLHVGFSNPHEKQEVKEDSYWSNVILQSSPEGEPTSKSQKRKGGFQKKSHTKKTKRAGESVPYNPKAPTMDAEQNNLLVGFSNPREKLELKEEKTVELAPTALILSFNDYYSIPSAADLIKIFRCYGSLREEETEVLRENNRAKVVFKYRHDAENAFRSAGQFDLFGPALDSYRLSYSPSPKSSPASSPLDMNYALPTKDGDLKHQGQEDIGVAVDNM